MKRGSQRQPLTAVQPAPVHCAVYTRVSTDEGLGQDFNSLHNQREACEAYVAAQRANGWQVVATRYDDGGYSGGNMDRPGLRQLVADVEAGKYQRVLVYKIDRLSRRLSDFSKLADIFEAHGASIVSVTQQFDTATSMGRLTLHMLLSFAQFEREQIAERTQHKMAAARRRGKRTGGTPPLGYDIRDTRLVINEPEAAQVREVFRLYLEHQAVMPVVRELNRRGWRSKTWTTKKGRVVEGTPFEKGRVHRTLTNWQYVGKVLYEDEVYDGEHEAIVSEKVWNRTQQILERNRLTGGAHQRTRLGALLSGLLRCGACGAAMIHAPSKGRRGHLHRYYTCRTKRQQGADACRIQSVPAKALEEAVVAAIRDVGKDPAVVAAAIEAAGQELQRERPALEDERAALQRDIPEKHKEMSRLVKLVAQGKDVADAVVPHLVELQEAIRAGEERLREVEAEIADLDKITVDKEDLRQALGLFDPVWDALLPRERSRVLHLLLDRVDYQDGKLGLTFRPGGIRTLAADAAAEGES